MDSSRGRRIRTGTPRHVEDTDGRRCAGLRTARQRGSISSRRLQAPTRGTRTRVAPPSALRIRGRKSTPRVAYWRSQTHVWALNSPIFVQRRSGDARAEVACIGAICCWEMASRTSRWSPSCPALPLARALSAPEARSWGRSTLWPNGSTTSGCPNTAGRAIQIAVQRVGGPCEAPSG